MSNVKLFTLLSTISVLSSCGLSPSKAPNFEEAMECATLNALASNGEPNSEEAGLAEKWLAYAARQPSQSKESVAARHDLDWDALQEKLEDMSDAEMMKFTTSAAFRCVGFEENYGDELDGISSKKS